MLLAAVQEIPSWFVVVMGIGTVFAGLIAIIIIISITSKVLNLFIKDKVPVPVQKAPTPSPAAEETIPNREEFVAAVAAAIAEDLGTDISKIQILSIKKL